MKLNNSVHEFVKIFNILDGDLKHIYSLDFGSGSNKFNGFQVRNIIRMYSALHESLLFNLRQIVLAKHEETGTCLKYEEILILREMEANLKDTGKVHLITRYRQGESMIKFTVYAFSRAFTGKEVDLGVGDQSRFGAYKHFIDVRNKLVHPKHVQDVDITPESWDKAHVAISWFDRMFHDLIDSARSQSQEFENAFKLAMDAESAVIDSDVSR